MRAFSAILTDLHVGAHDAGEHGVVGLTVWHMEGAAEGIAQRMHSGAASVGESNAGVGAGEEKIFEQRLAGFWAACDDGFESVQNEIDGFVAEELADRRGFWRERRFDGVHERVDGAGGKWFHWQAFEQLRNEHGIVREHGWIAVAGFGAAADEREGGDAGDFAAGAAGGWREHELAHFHWLAFAVVEIEHWRYLVEHEKFGNVEHTAAADADDALVILGDVAGHGFDHFVRRFPLAIILRIDEMAAGEKQIPFADGEFFGKLFDRIEAVKRWFH